MPHECYKTPICQKKWSPCITESDTWVTSRGANSLFCATNTSWPTRT